MENEIKELEERLRAVEGYIKMLIGGAIVLAVCALAFPGIEYWRVPAAVQSAIRERIDQTTLSRITDANTLAENLLKNAKNNQSWDENTKSGFGVVGETLICFGTHDASPAELPYTRKFNVTFPPRQMLRLQALPLPRFVIHRDLHSVSTKIFSRHQQDVAAT